MFWIWAAILILSVLGAAGLGFIDLPAGVSEVARILFYLVVAISVLILVAALTLVRKAKSFARTSGVNLSWTSMLTIMRYAQLFRKGRGKLGR